MNIDRVAPRRASWFNIATLVVVPLIVVSGFLLAGPGAASHRERAAVVDLDQGATVAGAQVALGRDLSHYLTLSRSQTDLAWVKLDAEAAARGLASGELALSVTIPPHFSKAATSFSTDPAHADQAVLGIQTSQTRNAAGVDAGRIAALNAIADLNKSLTGDYIKDTYISFTNTEARYRVLADRSDQLAFIASGMSKGMQEAAKGSEALAKGSSQLATGLDQLRSVTAELPPGARTLADGTAAYVAGVDALTKASMDAQRQLLTATENLAMGADGLSKGLTSYYDAVQILGTNAELVSAAQTAAVQTASGAVACPDFGVDEKTQAAMCAAFEAGRDSGAQAGAAVGVAVGTQASANALTTQSNGATLLTGAQSLAQGAHELHSSLAEAMDDPSAAQQMSALLEGGQALRKGSSDLANGLPALAEAMVGASDGARQLTTSASRLSDGLTEVSDRGQQLSDGAAGLSQSIAKERDDLPSITAQHRDRLSTAAAAPVVIADSNSISPGGIGGAAAIAALALWLGALATHLTLKPTASRDEDVSASRLGVTSVLRPGLLVMTLQAVAVALVTGPALGLSPGSWAALAAALALAGATFSLVIQGLVLGLGNAGRLASLALGVLGAVATIPATPTGPTSFLSMFTPVTPAVETIRGALDSPLTLEVTWALLAGWALLGAVMSLVAILRTRRAKPQWRLDANCSPSPES